MTNNSEDPFEKIGSEFLFQDSGEEFSPQVPDKKKSRKRKGGRNFWIVAGILLALFVLLVGALSLLSLYVLPRIEASRMEQAALVNAHNTATVGAATSAALLVGQVVTNTPTATMTEIPTSTPVIILFTEVPTETQETGSGAEVDAAGQTATAQALSAQEEVTATPDPTLTPTATATSTALPDTGLAEDAGLPGFLLAAAALVFVIILARRVRLSA